MPIETNLQFVEKPFIDVCGLKIFWNATTILWQKKIFLSISLFPFILQYCVWKCQVWRGPNWDELWYSVQ